MVLKTMAASDKKSNKPTALPFADSSGIFWAKKALNLQFRRRPMYSANSLRM